MLEAVVEDLDDILWEIRASRPEDEDIDIASIFSPGPTLQDVLDEIPRSDVSFQAIGNTLWPHSLIPAVSLFPFLTFRGAIAYQPCSRDMEQLRLFDALKPIQGVEDTVFEQARDWSCSIQAIEDLPRDIRWLMATIYNFATEMLRFDNNETYLWDMRNWLMH
ncbi:hypothetical protein K4F52_002706 [Lecanicillium sp. MT-2017a]|nr:hypothetical protein K4F52_002706 [Lecanicillium sp. MT-2017a]